MFRRGILGLHALRAVSGWYVDPTSGGILLQLLLGGSIGFLVALRLLGGRIRQAVRFRRRPDDTRTGQ